MKNPGPIRMERTLACALIGLSCLAALAACSPKKGPTTCKATSDCPSGESCIAGVCGIAQPCGGMCAADQICEGTACKTADGVSCAAHPDICPKGFICAMSGVCERQCTVSSDCPKPGFNICDPNRFVCSQCAVDLDCTTGANAANNQPYCDTSTGLCVGCLDDTSCYVQGEPAGQHCDMTTQMCVTGCLTVADCPPGTKDCMPLPGSSSTTGACIECMPQSQATDCLSGLPVCNPATLQCVQCNTNADCSQTTGQCDTSGHQCVTCVENQICAPGQVCNLNTFECMDGCVGGAGGPNCPPETVCNAQAGPNGTCVACLQDTDCPFGQICSTATPTDGGPSGPACVPGCTTDDRCNPTVTHQVCDPTRGSNGECVGCVSNNNCPANTVCDSTTEQCRCGMTGESCSEDSDCGYKLVAAPDGGMVGICDTQEGRCISQVQCGPPGCSITTQIHPVCTLVAQGLADQCSADQGDCPSNFAVEFAAGSSGTFQKVCVPIADSCYAPYCGNGCP
jgi:Cys-rich repeat protein